MLYALQLISWFPFILIFLYLLLNFVVKGNKAVCVVVLGDIGRSPRMQYHAVSLAQEGFSVDIVGYGGSSPHKEVMDNNNISVHYMKEPPRAFKAFPRIVSYFVKVIWQSAVLAFTLLLLPKSKYIFLQNPPAIPTIAVCWLVSLLRFSHLVVDWHNYGYTILALSLRQSHPLVVFSKWYEKFCGRFAKSHLCVTRAMKEDLKTNWDIQAVTLYDRPPQKFQKTPIETKHSLFARLGKEYAVFSAESDDSTVFTTKDSVGKVTDRKTKPVLLVSSTSWTEDEDFGILLGALEEYEAAASENLSTLPEMICVITGKGPLKEFYKTKISEMSFSHIQFCLPWLTAEDYPLLLGSADIGVCLHKSSSGLDLPMKVVDMFGCGLPVCAVHFDCLSELVQHGENGRVFHDSQELAAQLQDLLKGFPDEETELKKMRSNIKSFQAVRWHDQWKQVALPLFGVKVKED